jgi:hypothetical protein
VRSSPRRIQLTQEQAELLCQTYDIEADDELDDVEEHNPELAQACRALIKIAEGE